MAENANAPAIAPASDGSTGQGAAKDAADLKTILASVKTLQETFTKKSSEWDNLRSLHDRQMTELRTSLGKGNGRTSQEDDDPAPAAAAGSPRPISAREIAAQRDNAIIKFRMEHPDWQEYWNDIEAIGSDGAKARPFVRYTNDPDTGELMPDFYSSLVDIRAHLELQRLRTSKDETSPAGAASALNKGQAKADASAIGGSAASIPTDALGADYAKLSYNDKVKRLYELGLLDVDPTDLPEALRKR